MAWLALLLSLTLAGGGSPSHAEDVQITLERTACFGMCPVYTVTLSGDGTVRYEGRRFVRETGTRTWKIDAAAVAALAKEMEAAGYFELQDRYTARITDLPTTRTSLRIGTRSKTIEDYFGAPDTLHQLEKRIDEVADVKKCVTIDGATFRQLVANGLSLDSATAREWFADAVERGDAEVVEAFLSLGFEIQPIDGAPAILRARAEVFRLLIDAGQSVRARGPRNATPLDSAASEGDPDAVALLLTAGADVNARNSDGQTPLMAAINSGSAETVRRLPQHGADRTLRDSHGHTALEYARQRQSAPYTFGPNEYAQIVNLLSGGGIRH